MVNFHGLHNLIWVWTREPNDDAWYPGDEYVDIVGRDIYRDGDHSSQVVEFNDMTNRYKGKKMITISECGSMPDVDNLVKDMAGWSYFMPWYGKYVQNSTYNSLTLWKKMFASDYVITLDEMPNLKTYSTESASIEKIESITVTPTYFKESFTVSSPINIHTVSIYNLLGSKIKTVNTNANNLTISMAESPSGIYLVKADNKAAVKVVKR